MFKYLSSVIRSRTELIARMGKSFNESRNLYKACGYPETLDFYDYMARYERQEVAKRIINAPVFATWRIPPDIEEDSDPETSTEFEKKWEKLVEKTRLWHYIRRSDILAGIGKYSVLLLGFDDGLELNKPVTKASNLSFIQPYSEPNAIIERYNTDNTSERYGMPEEYRIKLTVDNQRIRDEVVHWSRIIHISEGLLEDNFYGTPRLKCVYNRLQDLETIVAGSAEMFWQGAFPGVIYSMDKDADPDSQTIAQMDDEILKYVHKMRRYMKLQGVTPHQLSPKIQDPTNWVMTQLKLISTGSTVPLRILIGSERGQLASTQDDGNWHDRIDERRTDFGENILRDLINRFIKIGILPKVEDYKINWPDIDALGEEEQAKVGKIRSDTLLSYSNAINAQNIYPPKYFLKNELRLSKDVVREILKTYTPSDVKLDSSIIDKSEGDNNAKYRR